MIKEQVKKVENKFLDYHGITYETPNGLAPSLREIIIYFLHSKYNYFYLKIRFSFTIINQDFFTDCL